jgi:hypothetical protein
LVVAAQVEVGLQKAERDTVEVPDIRVYWNPRLSLVVVVEDSTSQVQAEMVLLHLDL